MKDEWKKKNWLNIRMIRKTILDLLRVFSNAWATPLPILNVYEFQCIAMEWKTIHKSEMEKCISVAQATEYETC